MFRSPIARSVTRIVVGMANYLVVYIVITVLLSAYLSTCTEAQHTQWDFVFRTTHQVFEIDKCQAMCEHDPRCVEWIIRKSNENVSTAQYLKANESGLLVDCYLLSAEFIKIGSVVPDLLAPSRTVGVHGTKGDGVDMTSVPNPTKLVQSQLLIASPLAIDTSTLLNFQQHFTSQCAYTVSLWIWLWRPRQGETTDKVVFTTKEVYPRVSRLPAVLPAIVYNIGALPDQFFFAAAQGRAARDYLGLHRGHVRYHQWVHLALTVEHNTLRAYQDGELLDAVAYGPGEIQPLNKCAYETNMHVRASGGKGDIAQTGKQHKVSSGEAFYDSLIADPFAAHVNNTVLYVGGQPNSLGQHSTAGMVHGLAVLRNLALSPAQVRELSERTRPPPSPHLQALLRQHRIPSLEGLCPVPVAGDWYRQWEWGLCPEVLCGPQCLDENIYLEHWGEKAIPLISRRIAMTEALGIPSILATAAEEESGSGALHSKVRAGSGGTRPVPEIGHPLATSDGDDDVMGEDWQAQGNHGPMDAAAGLVLGGGLLNALVPALGPVAWLLQDLLLTVVSVLFGPNPAGFGLGSPSQRPSTLAQDAEPAQSSPARLSRDTRKGGRAKNKDPRELQAQQLYTSSMALLSDCVTRHSNSTAPASDPSGAARNVSEQDFTAWRAEREEPARAALTLGLWLAGDATAGRRDPRDFPWSFKEAPLLSQPLRLALGYRTGFHKVSDQFVPAREVDALLAAPEDSYLLGTLLSDPTAVSALLGHSVRPMEPVAVAPGSTAGLPDQHALEPPRTDSSSAASYPATAAAETVRDAYAFTVNEQGEVELTFSGPQAGLAGSRTAIAPRSRETDWLEVFATLTTDNVTAALQGELRPLAQAGLSAAFLRRVILDKQVKSVHSGDQHRVSDAAVAGVTVPADQWSFVGSATGTDTCRAAAAHYFPVTQYVAAQFGASHSGAGPMEEVRLIVSGGPPEGHRGRRLVFLRTIAVAS
jgi:hypothetical protein